MHVSFGVEERLRTAPALSRTARSQGFVVDEPRESRLEAPGVAGLEKKAVFPLRYDFWISSGVGSDDWYAEGERLERGPRERFRFDRRVDE